MTVHQCETPGFGVGSPWPPPSRWRCDCGQRWTIHHFRNAEGLPDMTWLRDAPMRRVDVLVVAAVVAFVITVAFFALRWGDPALPDCPKDRTPTVRCSP